MTRRGNPKTRRRDRVRVKVANVTSALLMGIVHPGARCRFEDGTYTVVTKGQVGHDWWIARRADGYTTVFKEQDILGRLV